MCGALGWDGAGLLLGRGVRERVLGGLTCAITLAASAATGTRGAWVGAVLVVACGVVVAGWRLVRGGSVASDASARGASGKWVAVVAALVVMCGAAVWFAAGETIAKRARETREEVARAMDGDYSTFTGARLAMWGWAGRAFSAHPVIGVGEGGYKAWVEREIASGASAGGGGQQGAQVHAHAHSMVLHAAAVTGLVGVVLLGELVIVCVWNGLRGSHSTTETATDTKWQASSGYDAGPALAMVGLACAGLFDSIQVNQQTAYWMWVLVALCMQRRPAAAVGPIWRKEQKEFAGVGSGGGVA